ncbi:Uncharacterised protein [uncultured archaeon]|nr:Uncharacterised protein [uncultured archaeon]
MSKKIIALGLAGLAALSGFAIADNSTQNTSIDASQNMTINATTTNNTIGNATVQPTITSITTVSNPQSNLLPPGQNNRIDKVIARIQKEITMINTLATRYSTAGDTDASTILTGLGAFEQTSILTPLTNAQATGNATMILNALRTISNTYQHVPATLAVAKLKAQIDEIEKKTQDPKITTLLTAANSDLDQVLQLAAQGRQYAQGDLNTVWKKLLPDANKKVQAASLWMGVTAFVNTWTKNLNTFETNNKIASNSTLTVGVTTALTNLQNIQNPTTTNIRLGKNAVIKAFNNMRANFNRQKLRMMQKTKNEIKQIDTRINNLRKQENQIIKNLRGGQRGRGLNNSNETGNDNNETNLNTNNTSTNSTNSTG